MKAIVYKKYGPPDVVSLEEVPKPIPANNELLIKVHSSTISRTDAGFRSAVYIISRFWTGLFKPKRTILGSDFSGIIEEVGNNVSLFKKGDAVFGFDDKLFGGHGEYMTLPETAAVVKKSDALSFEDAAALSEGAHYALTNIRAAKVNAGDHVLVYGATGAIGSAAVQLLKHVGAHVTAVSNSKNMDLVQSLGAEKVLDYQTDDFTKTDQKFSFIFDAVGKSSFKVCKPLLTEKGIYISTELGKRSINIFLAMIHRFSKGKKVLFPIPTISKEDLLFFQERFEKGEFKPVIERSYTMEQIVDAYTYVESGQKTGNVVLKIIAD